jgi:hypothetical protein
VKPALFIALVLLISAASRPVQAPTKSSSKTPAAVPAEVETWMVSLSNVYKDSDENYGHGEGDELYVIVHGEVAVGGISELEGSQIDPPFTCMTGTYHHGFLRLQSDPTDTLTAQINVRGKVYTIPHGHAFHGRITGGPFHSDPNGGDPHFPAIVTLQSHHDELDNSPSEIAENLATDSCACQWKRRVSPNSFITAKCDSPAKKAP